MGWRVSTNCARCIGGRASVFDDSQMMLMSACLLEKTDVAVAFSHCGQTAVVIDAVRQARRNGARIIAVTNCRTSILAQESDVVLCPNVEESLITGVGEGRVKEGEEELRTSVWLPNQRRKHKGSERRPALRGRANAP
jgi:RpiR family transcriptional regulator, repressor of rpiB and als operon